MLYNRFLEHFILPAGDFFLGTHFIKELNRWRKISHLNNKELDNLSKINLSRILDFACNNVPFYRKFISSKNSDPELFLKKLPVVNKISYNTNREAFISCPVTNLIPSYSSGSSGVQGVVYMSKKEQSVSQAIQTLFWEWSGYYPGKPIVQTGITPERGLIKSLKDLFFKTRYYSAFGFNNMELLNILKKQINLNNYHIGGYASSLFLLAKTAIDNNIENVKFDAAISWGDKLFSHYRNSIERAFGCKVFDTYGTTEGTMIAAQKDLNYYYIITPHVYIEILDDDGNEVPDGKMGNVVVTRLDCFSMPIIRYRNGDLAVKLPAYRYPEKREFGFPLLEKIIGRDTDIVYTPSGNYLIVHFFTGIFEHIPEIEQFKVIQHNKDSIIIEFIPGKYFNISVLDKVESRIFEYLKEEFKIEWRKVDYIKPSPSGKPQIIESYIKKSS